MNRFKSVVAVLIALTLILSVFSGCAKQPASAPGSASAGTASPGPAAAGSASPSAKPSPSPSPSPTVNPQKDFIDGAKTFLSTDLVDLFTGQQDGKRLVGMLSDFLNDLNTKTTQTAAKVTLSNVVLGKSHLDQDILVDLGAQHDAKSGDTAVTLSLGSTSDSLANVGVFLNGKTAVLKPSSASENIMLYTMPDVHGANSTFADKAMILMTGLFSDDGKAFTLGSNMKDRQDLTARFLDPWLKDTSPSDYSDKQITAKLIGKDVPLRSVTLNMTGQKAYDFVLKNMSALQADAQFAQTDRLLGSLMSFLSTDPYAFLQDVAGKGKISPITSAVGDLVTELKALTPDEITKAKFVVSLLFDGKKVVGINIEASTTGKAFLLDGIIYRKGLEHQLDLHYQGVKGEAASISLSTVSAGGDAYTVSGKLDAKNAAGAPTYSGGYSGKLTETDAKYDLTGTMNLAVAYKDKNDAAQAGQLSGDLTLSITHDASGYKATGGADISADIGDKLSAKAVLDIGMTYPAAVTIAPPKYTSENVTAVTNKKDLWAIHAGDLGDMSKYSSLAQDIRLLVAFLISADD